MKTIALLALAASLSAIGLFQIAASRTGFAQSSADLSAKQQSSFACNRMALTAAQRRRHFKELGPALRSREKSVRELANGFEFELPADPATLQLAVEWASGERACCPFFEITLRLDAEGGPLWLGLSGRTGVKQFIEADAASWLKP
jgi:hypothetical protein